MKKAFPLLLFLVCATHSYSQTDSLSKPHFTRLNNVFFQLKESHLREDTTLDNHFNYFKPDFNGSLGLPSQELFLENRTQGALGIRYFVPNYRQHFFTSDDIAFYTVDKKPYTRAFALVGQRQEQILRLIHSQNIRKQFNYTIKFNRYKSNGFYKNQLAIGDNLMTSVNYQTKNNRYKIKSWALYNKLRHNENGGITNDSLLTEFLSESKELVSVNLRDARRATKNLNTGALQLFKLNTGNDSGASHYLFHSFSYSDDFFVYGDKAPASGFYETVFIDSTETRDSAHVRKILNSVGYNLQLPGAIKKDVFVQYRNEIGRVKQFYNENQELKEKIDSTVMNHFVGGGIHAGTSYWDATIFADYVIAGENQNDFNAAINFMTNFKSKNTLLNLSLHTELRSPDVFYSRFYGNNFQWQNDFDKVGRTQVNASLSLFSGILNLESQSRLINNYIYFHSPDSLIQKTGNMMLSRNGISGSIKFWRFRLNPAAHYQFTDVSGIISLPSFVGSAQFYYDARLFKNNLHLQVGFQASYYSEFESNAYVPATNSYYVSGRKTLGNYPFADFFINAEIKPVRFFVKMEHVNQGMSGSNYMLTPNYPMPDRAFKFGFTWLFWD